MQVVTTETIINTMKEWVEEKTPISPARWIDAAAKMNVLIGDENDRLYTLESEIAKMRAKLLEQEKMTVAKANAIIEANDMYMQYRKQGAYVKQIQEFIRIAKKQASLQSETYMLN